MFTRWQQNCFAYQDFVSVFNVFLEWNRMEWNIIQEDLAQ